MYPCTCRMCGNNWYSCTCMYLFLYIFPPQCVVSWQVCGMGWQAGAICSFLRGAAGGGFGRPWPRHKLLRCSRRGGKRDKKPGRRRAAPLLPSPPFPPPLPPHPLLVVGQHIRVRSHGRRSVQPCEGCQGYYGDVYWGRGISQLILNCSMLPFV